MPADDGVRLDEDQRVPPVLEGSAQQDPQEPIAVRNLRSLARSLEDTELMPKRQVLREKAFAIDERESQHEENNRPARKSESRIMAR